jgi:chromatin remodeling complex protein RSC6
MEDCDLMKTGSAVTEHALSISDYCTNVSGHIKKAKKDDIKKQMEFIPDIYKQFYLNITATNDEEDCISSRELEDEELEEPSTSSGKNKDAKKATRHKKEKSSVIRG